MILQKNFNILSCKTIPVKKIIECDSLVFDKNLLNEKINEVFRLGLNDTNKSELEILKDNIFDELSLDLSNKIKDTDTKYILYPEIDKKDIIMMNFCLFGENDEKFKDGKKSDPIDPQFEYKFIKKVGIIKRKRIIIKDGEFYYICNSTLNHHRSIYKSYTEMLIDIDMDLFLNKLNILDNIFKERKAFIKYVNSTLGGTYVYNQSFLYNTYIYSLKWFIQSFFKLKGSSVNYTIHITKENNAGNFPSLTSKLVDSNTNTIDLKGCSCSAVTLTAGSIKNMVIHLLSTKTEIVIHSPVLDFSLIEEAIKEMNENLDAYIGSQFIYKINN